MKKKEKPNWFLRVVFLLFLLYISLSIAMETGYYESKLNEKTIMTEESIKQFEQDVRDGKNVDIQDYLIDKNKDYSNGATKLGVFVSSLVQDFMAEGINKMVDICKKLFTQCYKTKKSLIWIMKFDILIL